MPRSAQLVHPQQCVVDLIQTIGESIFDETKVQQNSKTFKGAHDVIVDFTECVTDQPSMVHEDKQLDKVEKVDTMVLPMVQDKIVLIPHIYFVILEESWNARFSHSPCSQSNS